MASLYQLGLINGFYREITPDGAAVKPAPVPPADALLRLDITDGAAEQKFHAATVRLVERIKARGSPVPGYVPLATSSHTWSEIRRGNEESGRYAKRYFGVHTHAIELTRLAVSLWFEHPDLHCVVMMGAAVVLLPHPSNGIEEWALEPDSFRMHPLWGADITDALARKSRHMDDLKEEMIYLARVSFTLHQLNLQGMLEGVRAEPPRLSFSQERRLGRLPDPGTRKRLLRDVVVREVDVTLTLDAAAKRDDEWVEFDPLAGRQTGRVVPYTPRRQHEVEGFKRTMKKSGKVVMVKPHVRGNPALGIVKRMKNVILPKQ